MKCIPRASFSIAILDDEDFGVLMEDPGGMEAFGLFVAIIIAGRSRLQLERAERVGQTDALVFADRNRHLLSMIHADQGQFDRCIAAFARVARETGGEPWVYLDQGAHLVIRSFFKFNTNTGWGGSRGGAGRKPSRNQDGQDGIQVFQDDSVSNHLEKNGPVGAQSSVSSGPVDGNSSVSSGIHSGTGTGTGTTHYITPRISEHTKPVEAKSIPPQGELDSPKFESQPARTPEDLADIRAAEKILRADLRTDALAERLTREHSLRANIKVAGWKWIRAAEKMTSSSVTDSQRKQFNYFASIAANTSDGERAAKPRQFGSDESVPYKPSPAKNVYVSQKSRERLAKLAEMGIAV